MDERPGGRSMWKVSNVNNVNLEIRSWWAGIQMVIWELAVEAGIWA